MPNSGRTRAVAGLAGVSVLFGAAALAAAAARAPSRGVTEDRRAPFAMILGTAQDGGLPQAGGAAPEDEAARRDPRRRRLVASLLVVDPASSERFLIDATPDLREQVDIANRIAPRPKSDARPPLFDAIALTHAHVGHYAGLMHLGREAYGANAQRVLTSDRMAAFLEHNGPWDLLVKLKHIAIERFSADKPTRLNDRLTITPVAVPHRDEYSDTHGFIVRGPTRSILWLPDIDKWERFDRRIEDLIASVDVACLDGTFYDGAELPGRAMSEIPHPFVAESLARFAALPANERAKIVFIHLNHTNPAATPGSPAQRAIKRAGLRVAVEGERLPL